MFSRNGRTCRDNRYTVFEVGIPSAANVCLSALNAKKPSFGLPIAVGTNSINANLNLDLKVRLQTGRVRLSFANATGSFRMLYHNPYAGEWRTLNPPLIPDMNFDGRIDDADIAEYSRGRLFRYWMNEDTVKGDYDGHIPDYKRNAADGVVNGRYDLINLFAARLDLRPFIDAWGSAVRFELSAYSEDAMRYCAVDIHAP